MAQKSAAKRRPDHDPRQGSLELSTEPAREPVVADKATKADKASTAPKKPARARVTAETMSEMQREISISEFFTKNRHLLGFDNASRALLTSIKEAVDNSLDACEEAGILPDIKVVIEEITENRFKMTVEDNGPGIVKAQVPKVFGKLLYGSKFHRLRQSRGQQGIGISAAGMYGQLTTGKPVVVTSKTGKGKPAYHFHIRIDTASNKPAIVHEDTFDWADKDHGTSVAIEMEAVYKGGKKSIDEFIQQVAFANPHLRLEYWRPHKSPLVYPRVSSELPPEAKEIKPHPYGIELGMLLRMLQGTSSRTLGAFLSSEFSRVTGSVADELAKKAGIKLTANPKNITEAQAEALYKAIGTTKIMAPPTTCLAPIGEAALLEGVKALLVQQHFGAEEAKARRKAEEEAASKLEGAAAVQAAAQAESKVTEALQSIKQLALDDDEDDEDDDTDAQPRKAAEGDVTVTGEPFSHTGVIEVFGHPCFVTAVTRSPRVYRGNPFQVEAALAYGGELPGDELAQVVRFANRVPLLYQQGACAMSQAVVRTNWKGYDVEQARGALPTGPLLIMVHIASVWVPFTSEAKEAVAHYDEIIGELKFALQECGRRLSRHIRRRRRAADEQKKANYIQKYIPHIGIALQQILGFDDKKKAAVISELTGVLERSRKM